MYRVLISVLTLSGFGATPALAEGFSAAQFTALIVVNLGLGAIVTLFLGILGSVILAKLKTDKKVPVKVARPKS